MKISRAALKTSKADKIDVKVEWNSSGKEGRELRSVLL